jgi:hypothetical protein
VGRGVLGLAAPDGCWPRRLVLLPHRDYNRRIASQYALDLVRLYLVGAKVGDPA